LLVELTGGLVEQAADLRLGLRGDLFDLALATPATCLLSSAAVLAVCLACSLVPVDPVS